MTDVLSPLERLKTFLRRYNAKPLRRENDLTFWSVGGEVIIVQDYGDNGFEVYISIYDQFVENIIAQLKSRIEERRESNR